MLAIVPSATLHGLDGRFIRVEVDVAPGLPGFTIVGLADAALQEARERVRGALRNAGFAHPPRRITVNLAPADLRKAGASLDLAMAVGILLGLGADPGRARTARAHRRAVARRRGPVGAGRPADGRRPGPARAAAGRGRGRRRRRGAARRRASRWSASRRCATRSRSSRRAGAVDAPRPRRNGSSSSTATRAADDGAAPAQPAAGSAGSGGAGPGRGARPGRGATRSGDRPGRRPRPAADRAAGLGQDPAGADDPGLLPPLDDRAALAATVVASAAGEGPIDGAPPAAALPRPAPHALVRRDGRWRPAPVARRGHPRRPGRPVPRRAARVRPRRPRGAPPADGGGPRGDLAGRAGDELPGAVPARRGDEPVPVRLRRHVRSPVRLPAAGPGALPATRLRPAPRPDRPVDRDAAGRADGARARAGPGRVGRRRGPDRGRASRRHGPDERLAQRPPHRPATARGVPPGASARNGGSSVLAELERASGRGTERLLRVARTIADLAGAAAVEPDHLDEAAWYRPADVRLAAVEAR